MGVRPISLHSIVNLNQDNMYHALRTETSGTAVIDLTPSRCIDVYSIVVECCLAEHNRALDGTTPAESLTTEAPVGSATVRP
ncbi:MAG: hypothetical protein AB7U39_24230 [Ilumatobacteraceae bacterium]